MFFGEFMLNLFIENTFGSYTYYCSVSLNAEKMGFNVQCNLIHLVLKVTFKIDYYWATNNKTNPVYVGI